VTLVLTHTDVAVLLDRDQTRIAVESAFAGLAGGDYHNPAPRALPLPGNAVALPMTATGRGVTAVKLLSDMPANRDIGLATQRSTILLSSAATGECVALIDGRAITAARTAAASAVATDHLARRSADVLGLIGAGNLAVEHVHAISRIRRLRRIVVWSRSSTTTAAFCERVGALDIPVESVPAPEQVFDTADIVCTLTPAREPVVSGDWFRPGQHINAVGAPPRPDHREVDGTGMRRARIVVDSIATALAKSGAVLLAIQEGTLSSDDLTIELGQVIVGAATGRTADSDITLFESVGLAVQDLVTADLVVTAAVERGVGTHIQLSA